MENNRTSEEVIINDGHHHSFIVVNKNKLINIAYFDRCINGNFSKKYDSSNRLIISIDKLESILDLFRDYISGKEIYIIHYHEYIKLLDFVDYIQDDNMNYFILNKLIKENNNTYRKLLEYIINNPFHLHTLIKVISINMTMNEYIKLRITFEEYDKIYPSRELIYEYLSTVDNEIYTNIYTGLYNIDIDIIKDVDITKLEKGSYLVKEKINYYNTIFIDCGGDGVSNDTYNLMLNDPNSIFHTKEDYDHYYYLNHDDYVNIFGNKIDKISLTDVYEKSYAIDIVINNITYQMHTIYYRDSLYDDDEETLYQYIGKTISDIRVEVVYMPFEKEDNEEEYDNDDDYGEVESFYDIIFDDGSILKLCVYSQVVYEQYKDKWFPNLTIHKDK